MYISHLLKKIGSEGPRLALGLPCLGDAAVNMRRTTLKWFVFCKCLAGAKLELLHCQVEIHLVKIKCASHSRMKNCFCHGSTVFFFNFGVGGSDQ